METKTKINRALKQEIKNKYIKAIYEFEEFVKMSEKNKNENIDNKGYLINLMDYNGIKKHIEYDKFKKELPTINGKLEDSEKFIKLKQIEFKTSQYLIDMINNDNEYILINESLMKNICENKEETPISYEIKDKKLILKLDKELIFNKDEKNNNILNNIIINKSSSINNNDSNLIEINNIYDDIAKYYEFEKKFLEELQNSNEIQKENYLISKSWFDKWKDYTNYENIKINYFDKKVKKPLIMNKLIYYKEEKKYNYDNLNPIEIMDFKKQKDFDSFLKKDSLIIMNSISFIKDLIIKPIKYKIHKKTIYFGLDKEFSFTINNNIIQINENDKSITTNNNNDLKDFKQITNYYCFRKEIFNQIESSQEEKTISKKIYLINEKIIKSYKSYFNYDKLQKLLNKNKIKEEKYENFEKKFENLIIEFDKNEDYKNYIEKISSKKIENYFKENDVPLKEKEIENNLKEKKKYIIEFEIISEDTKQYLIENNIIQEKNIMTVNYVARDMKLFIAPDIKDYLFEIVYFNAQDKNFVIDYLIEPKDEMNKILNFFNKKGIKKIIEEDFDKNQKCKTILDDNKNELFRYYTYKKEETEKVQNETENKNETNSKNKGGNEKVNNKVNSVENKNIIQNLQNQKEDDKVYNILNNEEKNDENKIQNNNIIKNNEDKEIIINVFSFFISIYLFDKIIVEKLEESKGGKKKSDNSLSLNECFLINKDFLLNIKEIFSYDKIKQILEKWNDKSFKDLENNIMN